MAGFSFAGPHFPPSHAGFRAPERTRSSFSPFFPRFRRTGSDRVAGMWAFFAISFAKITVSRRIPPFGGRRPTSSASPISIGSAT